MATDVRLPQLGESTYEATIGRWLKSPGDRVERFEPLVELITDKVNVEMPSPVAGRLVEIVAQEGQTLPVGSVIARVEEEAPAQAQPEAPARGEAPAAGRLSPLVSRLVQEHGITPDELAQIRGTGTGGRITKQDVLSYVERRKQQAAAQPVPPPAAPAAPVAEERRVPLSPVRRTIAERLSRAKREVPHAYGVVEADVTDLVRWFDAHREAFQQQHGVRLTYTALFARAAVEALRAFPVVNAQWADDAIVFKPHVNLGIAVSVEDGLVVPVVHRAEEKSLVGLARELEDLTRRAREGKLTLEDVQGGTFTLTNPGVFGSVWSLPIVNYPQAAILATDAIVKRPVVRDDAIAIRSVMHLGLSFDHRVFDGAVAVQFLNHVKASLEAVDPVTR
ncbi:MAG: dihydrolipoamide acetyltransferase family protein [Armatimonadota bacterium]|nr:dihydrolipoamide acetyltransferase family protein [Armatimonadota bacterium]MDR7387315.1 dihydrolipoamide acetyltransferase family protein [Armatimonadota bacterium]MDR7389407.1 dihydrolipoamide acetyltransferase family protein [Armatimonadota bacterium]MDR7391796.1 dihydrolipoamide acetyltransferase family protein [Armatimonadota bacterium]MDR7394498.1 dihydrolipoamide acetyltransferase family protein [Armatimonadota bacterium]